MREWFEGRVESGEYSLRYFRSGGHEGNGMAPLVLVHGFTDSALYFTRVGEALAQEWDVIAYDARGHGESDRSLGKFTDDTRADDLVAVIRGLGLNRPALLGHSMGGATIAHAVARNPGLSRAAVLEDPAWWEPSDREIEAGREANVQRNAAWRQWVEAIQAVPLGEALAQRAADESTWSPIDIATSTDARRSIELGLFDWFPAERGLWRSAVRALDCPTLLMTGGNVARGRIITPELAAEAQVLNPLVEVADIADAGHHLKYDCFDEFIGIVGEFLSRFRGV